MGRVAADVRVRPKVIIEFKIWAFSYLFNDTVTFGLTRTSAATLPIDFFGLYDII